MLELPRYTTKDYQVLLWVVFPLSFILNTFIFGEDYFSSVSRFLVATCITALLWSVDFVICGFVAIAMKARFPRENQVPRRLLMMIAIFIILSGLFLFLLFRVYENFGLFGYTFNERAFIWSYIALGIMNIFLTFLHEGIARFEEWKASLKETEQVRKAYKQSQLIGLKSQINPHFLFNSLNTLSSLISEDEDKAEKFLDEMSKIYRYMLRNDDEQLVPLKTELSFIHSYFYLLNTRYSTALTLLTEVREEDKSLLIAPLTLRTIVENAIAQNAFSKSSPLVIHIETKEEKLIIKNTLQRKIGPDATDVESGLDNLVEKYRLMQVPSIRITDNGTERIIRVPLITRNESVAV